MANEIAVNHKFKFMETSVSIAEDATQEEMLQIAKQAVAMQTASPWWIGDVLREMNRKFGETYAQYASELNMESATLRSYVYICNAIPPSERRPTLSFSHHRFVASMRAEDRARYLNDAENQGMTAIEFMEYIAPRDRKMTFLCAKCKVMHEDMPVNNTEEVRVCKEQ